MAVYGDELYHYGVPRKSGRYPYGSGKEPYQDNPKKRRLNKDESAPKATSKRPESIWAKHRRLQAEKRNTELREAKRKAAVRAEEERKKEEAAKPPSQKAKEMSDEELIRAINRLRLEQTYMSMLNPSNQQSQQQQAQQQAQKIKTTVDKGKRLIDKMKSGSKDIADLSQNIGNIMGGAQKAYANYQSIMKLMDIEKKRKGG
nr:MAG TPA: RNA dependent RNA polymerase [Caudoviricetes sp.]